MNQIEFVKKWAKVGDRVENNKIRYVAYKTKDRDGLYFQRFRDIGNASYHIDSIEWQSPKIYRLKITEPLMFVDGVSAYKERWQLVADYADMAKEEEPNILKQVEDLYEQFKKERPNTALSRQISALAILIEKRLKALEDKIK